MLHETIRMQLRFFAQHSISTLFRMVQHCSNIATLCCAKNGRCVSSRVTTPLEVKVRIFVFVCARVS